MSTPDMPRITLDPTICHGQPTIRGLRYPVHTLLELLSAGQTVDELLADFPDLEREDIQAALAYAARRVPLREDPAIGQWKDRADMEDSVEYVRALRRKH